MIQSSKLYKLSQLCYRKLDFVRPGVGEFPQSRDPLASLMSFRNIKRISGLAWIMQLDNARRHEKSDRAALAAGSRPNLETSQALTERLHGRGATWP